MPIFFHLPFKCIDKYEDIHEQTLCYLRNLVHANVPFPLTDHSLHIAVLGKKFSFCVMVSPGHTGCFSRAEKDLSMVHVTHLADGEQSQQLFEEPLHSLNSVAS